ncbi:hypothetical protein DV735_g4944, partial [Chaetothyriales sp. CBS 134920]
LFTDKADGAAASDSSLDQSSTPELAVPWRQTILQRLHIHSSGARPRPKLPPLDTRPNTAPSLPTLSIDSTTSDSDAIIAELAQIMPRSPSIQGPPHNSNKRSRSCESGTEESKVVASGNASFIPSTVDGKPSFAGVRLPAYLSKSKAEIQSSFEDLESKQRSRLHEALSNVNSPFKLDRSTTVLQRNRYGNIQPWEKSRIKLDSTIQGSNYINASPIKLEYIATQGPKDDQISHFWHMVMQQTPSEGGVIIMLTRLHEGLKEKCALYFPRDKDDCITIPPEPKEKQIRWAELTSDDGEYTEGGRVELISLTRDNSVGCQVRQLKLTFGDQSKTIHHYLYANWVDFGKPEAEDRLALLQLMRVSRQVAGDSARIVHCSAGVGRTGTWIALDFLLRELEEGRLVEAFAVQISAGLSSEDEEDEVSKSESNSPCPATAPVASSSSSPSIPTWGKSGPPKSTTPEPKVKDLIHETVDLLRTQRMMMVMNLLQYSFLYEALRDLFIDKYADKQSGIVVLTGPGPSSSSTARHPHIQAANDLDQSGLANNKAGPATSSDSQERSPKQK